MNLSVNRTTFTSNSAIGQFLITENFFSYCLEPVDRDLTSDMTPDQIAAIKIADKTCVPTGSCQVVSYFSPKHGRQVPLVQNVPGFAYIEIHTGNYPSDTDGCLLLGSTQNVDFIGNSSETIEQFYNLFFDAMNNGEDILITYQKN